MYDIIIVGAGTAGLSAAIYGVRSGKSVLVLEGTAYGGQIINTPEIENYPGIQNVSGFDFAYGLYTQAQNLGAEVRYEAVTSLELGENDIKIVKTTEETYEAKTVIIATGAKNRPLGLDNEKDMIGKGISYCAACDGAFYRGKTVAVVGGGNTALEDAVLLTNYCKKVYLIHRRDAFRGEQKTLELLKTKENVEFVLNATVSRLAGEDRVSAIEVEDKFSHEKREIAVDGVFVAIGQEPENKVFANLVELDPSGYVVAGESCETNVKGIFAAGDCRTKKVRQLATAAGDGAVAGLAASELCN